MVGCGGGTCVEFIPMCVPNNPENMYVKWIKFRQAV